MPFHMNLKSPTKSSQLKSCLIKYGTVQVTVGYLW